MVGAVAFSFGFSREPRVLLSPVMSMLAEVEAALETLPRKEQEPLYVHLGVRLETLPPVKARLAALDALQSSLALDERKSRGWRDAVQEARR